MKIEGESVDRRLRAALEATLDHVVLLDRDFRVLYVNGRVNELNGVPPDHYLGLTHWEAWPSSVGTDVERTLRRVVETGEPEHLEHNHAAEGGIDFWMEIDALPSEDGLAIFFRDVTHRHLAEDLLRAMADSVTSLVAYFDADLIYRFVNRRYEQWYGLDGAEIIGRHVSDVLDPQVYEVVRPHLQDALAGKEVRYEAWLDFADQGRRFLRVAYSPLRSVGGRIEGIHAQIEDATEDRRAREALATAKASLEDANERLERLASTDDLTGLKNVRAFRERLVEECAEAARSKRALALVLIDVDRFKEYNDAFGHPAGDEALKQVAAILRAESRTYDVAARYGGEEFALILPGTDAREATVVAERVRRRIVEAPWPKRKVTVSLGVAAPWGAADPSDLVARADRALYAAKEAGRNRVAADEDL